MGELWFVYEINCTYSWQNWCCQWDNTVLCCTTQGSICIWAQPMKDDVTVQRRLSLAGPIHRMIPDNCTPKIYPIMRALASTELILNHLHINRCVTCHNPFSKWQRSFQWKLCSHWLKVLWQCHQTETWNIQYIPYNMYMILLQFVLLWLYYQCPLDRCNPV